MKWKYKLAFNVQKHPRYQRVSVARLYTTFFIKLLLYDSTFLQFCDQINNSHVFSRARLPSFCHIELAKFWPRSGPNLLIRKSYRYCSPFLPKWAYSTSYDSKSMKRSRGIFFALRLSIIKWTLRKRINHPC